MNKKCKELLKSNIKREKERKDCWSTRAVTFSGLDIGYYPYRKGYLGKSHNKK